MAPIIRILLLLAVFWLPTGQAAAQVGFDRDTVRVVGGDGSERVFAVEMARSADQLAQGLMYRQKLAADAGMLFDFGTPRPVSMWMKNTLIPLDMLFIAVDGRVTGIAQRAVPQSLAIIDSPGPVKAVLELNGGTAQRLGLKVGDRVLHPLFGTDTRQSR